ncbi:hypothetical protein WJ971_05560 [Achromobacter xylosoxidans]
MPVALKDSLHWAGTVASGGSQTRSGVISDETAAAARPGRPGHGDPGQDPHD